MFLTPMSTDHTLRYAITTGAAGAEQQINAGPPAAGAWTHLAVTYGDGVGVLYVDGKEAGRNTSMTVEPSMFADHITQNYIGRSQYADPYLAGAVDDFRVYGRTLPASEVATLAGG